MVKKLIVVTQEVHNAIIDTALYDSQKNGKKVSYSKMVNYLVLLGIGRYNKIDKDAKITEPAFDFEHPHRKGHKNEKN